MSDKYKEEITHLDETISEILIKEGNDSICEVSMKWDGCIDVRLPYAHFCGEDDFNDFVNILKQELLNLSEKMNGEY